VTRSLVGHALGVALALACPLAPPALAGEPSSSPAEGQGTLRGVIFDAGGRPLAGARVRAGGAEATTDAHGAWALSLAAGSHGVSLVGPDGETVELGVVVVVAGRVTELLASLGPTGPVVSVESPGEALAAVSSPTGPPGAIHGTVTDPATGRPIAGARIYLRGSPLTATTGEDGRFSLQVPSGAWDLAAIRPGHASANLAVQVKADEVLSLVIALEKTGLQLSDVTVSAPRIVGGTADALDQRKESAAVSDILGAEQMSKAGDSDAAAALKRVTGLTVIDGKYVYVRGLGDRYSATLLNGSSLPSPEPEKRVVPLDIFPTSLVEGVVIQKTFSPDRPAEFGGGVVEVRTRGIPEKALFNIGVSGTLSPGTTFAEGRVGPEGPTDWLGFGSDYRALPASIGDEPIKAAGRFSDGGYSAEELEAFGEAMPMRWGLDARELPPDFGTTLNAGGRLRLGEVSFGGLAGFVFNNGWDIDEGTRSVYASGADGLTESRRTTFEQTDNTVRLGGAVAAGVEWEGHGSITSTTLLNRTSTSTGLSYLADDPTGSNDTLSERSSWVEQQLLFEQVAANYDANFLIIDARYSTAVAARLEPDRREWTYNVTGEDDLVLSQRGGWSDIQYLTLDDRSDDAALDLTVPVPVLEQGTRVKVGGLRATRARTSATRRFGYTFHGTEGIDMSAPIEDVMVPANIGEDEADDPGYLVLEENTINSDDYSAGQDLYAAYGLADVAFTSRLRAMGGVRFERSVQTVTTFEQFDTDKEPVVANLGSSDWLPAATVTYGLGPASEPDRMLVRLGYGRTLSRPEFRELTEVQYYDYRTGRTLFGNPDLRRATIDNVDARWEWYPRDGESVSAAAFFKYFDHPVESVVAVSAVSGSVGTFANATSATNYGVEFEARKRLDILAGWLADVYAGGNVSLIASEVDLSDTEGNQTSDQRPLQGQSPYVVNAQLSYENPDIRTNVSLLYNVFGPRIVDVGTSGNPDTYEMPVHRVDLVWTQGIDKHISTRLKGTNLLDWPSRQMVGDNVSEETRDGWSVGLGLTWAP
jgi:outer membrane receptor protein involved in Fe transport